jgi:DNA-binding NarL/FixJ family response regulator
VGHVCLGELLSDEPGPDGRSNRRPTRLVACDCRKFGGAPCDAPLLGVRPIGGISDRGGVHRVSLTRHVSHDAYVTVVVGRLDPLVSYGLAHVLEQDSCVQVIASDLEHGALENVVEQMAPKVAILDEKDEPFALARLRAVRSETGFLVLACDPSHGYGTELLSSGATCLARNVSIADILAAIHLKASGGRVFMPLVGDPIEQRYPSKVGKLPEPLYACDVGLLTRRETEVFDHVSLGRSNPEIARALQISVETVHTHVARIRHKLKVQSKRDLLGVPLLDRTRVR